MSKQKQDMVEQFDPEYQTEGLTRWLSDKESACQCRRLGFNPWVEKIPWRRAWQHTPVLLHGESHGQRSLVGYSPWCLKESDITEATEHVHTPRSVLIRRDTRELTLSLSPSVNMHQEKDMGRYAEKVAFYCQEESSHQKPTTLAP